jgi:hypothetical protein
MKKIILLFLSNGLMGQEVMNIQITRSLSQNIEMPQKPSFNPVKIQWDEFFFKKHPVIFLFNKLWFLILYNVFVYFSLPFIFTDKDSDTIEKNICRFINSIYGLKFYQKKEIPLQERIKSMIISLIIYSYLIYKTYIYWNKYNHWIVKVYGSCLFLFFFLPLLFYKDNLENDLEKESLFEMHFIYIILFIISQLMYWSQYRTKLLKEFKEIQDQNEKNINIKNPKYPDNLLY